LSKCSELHSGADPCSRSVQFLGRFTHRDSPATFHFRAPSCREAPEQVFRRNLRIKTGNQHALDTELAHDRWDQKSLLMCGKLPNTHNYIADRVLFSCHVYTANCRVSRRRTKPRHKGRDADAPAAPRPYPWKGCRLRRISIDRVRNVHCPDQYPPQLPSLLFDRCSRVSIYPAWPIRNQQVHLPPTKESDYSEQPAAPAGVWLPCDQQPSV